MLLIGEYVRVLIEGEELSDVYRIPRSAIRNDREVWIVNEENKLTIRPVETIWRDEDSVVVQDGLKSGELLVVSDIAGPVAGMPLRIEQPDEARQESGEQMQESESK
jgi:virulence-associated protein VagC